MNLGTIHKAISERVVAALLATLLLALISLTVHALDNKEKIMPQEVTLQLGKKGRKVLNRQVRLRITIPQANWSVF